VGEAVRALDRARLACVSHVVDAARRQPWRALVAARERRAQLLAGSRPRGRDAGLVAAAGRRLHTVLAGRPRRVLGSRGGLLHPERLALRAWRDTPALTRALGCTFGDHRDRGRWRRRGTCPRGARRRRDEGALREHLLGRSLVAERPAARPAARTDPRRCGDRNRRDGRHRSRPIPGLPLSTRLVLRTALRRAAGAVDRRRARSLRSSRVPAGTGLRVARRLLSVPVAGPGGTQLVDALRRAHSSRPGSDRRFAAELRTL